ncbi:carboxypeptidase-like regulatory domain-containing protein [Nanoarchaeota archaeon]
MWGYGEDFIHRCKVIHTNILVKDVIHLNQKRIIRTLTTTLIVLIMFMSTILVTEGNTKATLDALVSRSNTLVEPTQAEFDTACEAHVIFEFEEPAAGQDVWEYGRFSIVEGGQNLVDWMAHLQKAGFDADFYIHSFASIEGSSSFNQRLSVEREKAVVGILGENPIFQNKEYDFDAQGATDQFFPLTSAEKGALKNIRSLIPTSSQRQPYYDMTALKKNRRVIVSTKKAYLKTDTVGFFNKGCPALPDPTELCGNGIWDADKNEFCDQSDSSNNGCADPQQVCSADCKKCTAPSANCGNSKVDEGERCDHTATPDNCPTDFDCVEDCTRCKTVGEGGKGISKWWLLLLLLVLPFLFWIGKRRRDTSTPRDPSSSDINEGQEKLCNFLGMMLKQKEEVIEGIRELEEKIAKASPAVKKDFSEYIKHFRDPAYLRDVTSQESHMLDQAGKDMKDLFEAYLQMVAHMLELEELELTLINVVDRIEKGIGELEAGGATPILDDLQITARVSANKDNIKHLLPEVKKHAEEVAKETAKIEKSVEEYVREIAFTLELIGNHFASHKQWKKEFIKKHGKAAWEELWWVKKNLKANAQIYLRRETHPLKGWWHRKLFWRTPEHKVNWHWDPAQVVSTEHGSPEDQKWRARAKQYFGNKDVVALSAFIQKLAKDISANIDKNQHVMGNLFRISKAEQNTAEGISKTGQLKGIDRLNMDQKGFRAKGALPEEFEAVWKLSQILCKEAAFSVKIQKPENQQMTKDEMAALLQNPEKWMAKAKGGKPGFKYIFHWGPKMPAAGESVDQMVGSNIRVGKTKGLKWLKSGNRNFPQEKGWPLLKQRCDVDPFDPKYSIKDQGEQWVLHITAIDSAGDVASDHITISLKKIGTPEQIIEGWVMNRDGKKPVEGAVVHLTHKDPETGYSDKNGIVTVNTGEDGKFIFRGSFLKNITVNALKKELGQAGKHFDPDGNPDEKINLKPGEHKTGVIVPLGKSKEKLQTIAGKVVDHAGKPVVRAWVWLTHVPPKGIFGRPQIGQRSEQYKEGGKLVKVLSGNDGSFKITGTFRQSITAWAQLGDFKGMHMHKGGNPSHPISLGVGGTRDDVVVPINKKQMCTVEGLVVDDNSKPIKGAKVWIQHTPSGSPPGVKPSEDYKEGGKRVEATSDEGGRFVLAGEFHNMIVVYAEVGHGKGASNRSNSHPGHPFSLGKGQARNDIVVKISKGKKSIEGIVVNSKGQPINGATVWVTQKRKKYRQPYVEGGKRLDTKTLPNGLFRLEGDFGQDLLVFGEKGELLGKHTDQGGAPSGFINLNRGQVQDDVKVVLGKATLIEGKVIDFNENEVREAKVSIIHSPKGTPEQYKENGELVTAVSDQGGKFQIEGGFFKDIQVTAEQGDAAGVHYPSIGGAPNHLINQPKGGSVDKVIVPILKGKQAINGMVIDEKGNGVVGATVWVTHQKIGAFGMTSKEAPVEYAEEGHTKITMSEEGGHFHIDGDFRRGVVVYASDEKRSGKHIDKGGHPVGQPLDFRKGETKNWIKGQKAEGGMTTVMIKAKADVRLSIDIEQPREEGPLSKKAQEQKIKSPGAFRANITGGMPHYKYAWYWGGNKVMGSPSFTSVAKGNLQLMEQNDIGANVFAPCQDGWRNVEEKAKADGASAFDHKYSVDGKGREFFLTVVVQDGAGYFAFQQTLIRTETSDSTITGKVVDETGKPFPDATVWVASSEIVEGVGPRETKLTDGVDFTKGGKRLEVASGKDGTFQISGKFPSEKVLEVHAQFKKEHGVHTNKGGAPEAPFKLKEGGTKDGVVVPLKSTPIKVRVMPEQNGRMGHLDDQSIRGMDTIQKLEPGLIMRTTEEQKAFDATLNTDEAKKAEQARAKRFTVPELDFVIVKDKGTMRLIWIPYIMKVDGLSEEEIMTNPHKHMVAPRNFNLRIRVHNGLVGQDAKIYAYKEGWKSYRWSMGTTDMAKSDMTNKLIRFDTLVDVTKKAKPGLYRLYFEVAKAPEDMAKGSQLRSLLGKRLIFSLDSNYIEFRIGGETIVTPPPKSTKLPYPKSIEKELQENLKKVDGLKTAKIGDSPTPGFGDHYRESMIVMMKEIQDQLNAMNKIGDPAFVVDDWGPKLIGKSRLGAIKKAYSKYFGNPTKPYGLTDASNDMFYGIREDDKGGSFKRVIVKKFIFGVLDRNDPKGWYGRGVGIVRYMQMILGGNLDIAKEMVTICDEKDALFEKNLAQIKAFKAKIDKLQHEAISANNEPLLTVYDKIAHSFENIAKQIEDARASVFVAREEFANVARFMQKNPSAPTQGILKEMYQEIGEWERLQGQLEWQRPSITLGNQMKTLISTLETDMNQVHTTLDRAAAVSKEEYAKLLGDFEELRKLAAVEAVEQKAA